MSVFENIREIEKLTMKYINQTDRIKLVKINKSPFVIFILGETKLNI